MWSGLHAGASVCSHQLLGDKVQTLKFGKTLKRWQYRLHIAYIDVVYKSMPVIKCRLEIIWSPVLQLASFTFFSVSLYELSNMIFFSGTGKLVQTNLMWLTYLYVVQDQYKINDLTIALQ